MLRLTDEQIAELITNFPDSPPAGFVDGTPQETLADGLVDLGLLRLEQRWDEEYEWLEYVTTERGRKELELQLLARTVQA